MRLFIQSQTSTVAPLSLGLDKLFHPTFYINAIIYPCGDWVQTIWSHIILASVFGSVESYPYAISNWNDVIYIRTKLSRVAESSAIEKFSWVILWDILRHSNHSSLSATKHTWFFIIWNPFDIQSRADFIFSRTVLLLSCFVTICSFG